MGSRLSKFKQNVGSPMIMLRTKRRSTHRPSLSHDTALTQIDPTLESQTARPFKIRSKKRRRSDTMPTDMSRSSRSYDTSRRISQLTTRTSVTSPGTVVPRRSTPEELAEADRFDQQHYFLQLVTGLTMHVPIEQPRSCLDLATGTGIWVLETSSNFPNCEFLGVDIDSRSLPRDLMPTNCRFEQVDISKNLPFTNDSFDYIRHHWLPLGTVPLSGTSCQSVRKRSSQSVTLERKLSRSSSTRLNTAPSTDWELHLGRCYNICSPGGWLELMGTDAHIHSGSFIAYRFNKWMDRVEQRRRVHLRRRSGSKDKHTSGSFARYSVNSAQQPWSALPTPSTTGSGGSTTSAPAMRSSLPRLPFPSCRRLLPRVNCHRLSAPILNRPTLNRRIIEGHSSDA
ncbi:hypothetical protein BDF19DRAFT_411755 [Syncephalis fuscata]|nr:hypothetical protein BDF19DRAFT_411755 [Syncephalis fuscata]